nr:distal tail protein Dit [Romboutsia ilealis]
MIFNDIDFTGLIKILDIKKPILPPRTNYTTDVTGVHGSYYTGFKYGEREIQIDFAILCKDNVEYDTLVRVLADIFNVDGPKKLYIGEEMDKYYYAVPDVSDDLDQIIYNGIGSMTFICYDPIAYSDITKTFEGDYLTGITTVKNGGTVAVPPVISVAFTKTAHFCQVTNYDKKTILVGQRPSVDMPTATPSPVVLDDKCETTANWIASGNVLDSDVPKEVMGTITVNKYGTGITGNDYGTSERGWHGACVRKNLSKSLDEFNLSVDIAFDCKDTGVSGSGTSSNTSPSTSSKYKIVANPSLRIRKERNTTSKILGSIPNGNEVTITDIQSGWGKVTYGGATGYVSMEYTKIVQASTTNYKTKANLNLRKGRGTNYGVLVTIPKGTAINVTDISGGWGKVTYKNKTGYVSMEYVVSTRTLKNNTMLIADTNQFADYSKMGRVELYLFDEHSQKIGKLVVKDAQEFYEFTEPEVWIANDKVIYDTTTCPSPHTETKTENDKTVTVNVDSGKYGQWNDATIRLSLSKTKVGNQYQWMGRIDKVKDGKVVKTLSTNTLVNSKYPTGKLSSIVIWFGQYKSAPVVDTMSIESILINSISVTSDTEVNEPIFKNGDELEINCEEHKVYLNGMPLMNKLDIGSEFFSSGSGDSQFIVVSDDRDVNVLTGIQERYL